VKNPLRSEADAFRFVWQTIAYFAVIVVAYFINHWLGLAVFVVLTAGVAWWVFARKDTVEPPTRQAPAPHPPEQHRILVVANETVGGSQLLATIDARTAAQERLDASLVAMRSAGVVADGEVGDGDPIQAIEDALRTFRPDELVISTHPIGKSHWLERGVVEKARERFAVPVTHVVVDRP
jgi:hypothetical protein